MVLLLFAAVLMFQHVYGEDTVTKASTLHLILVYMMKTLYCLTDRRTLTDTHCWQQLCDNSHVHTTV
jgi:hypothetical protein